MGKPKPEPTLDSIAAGQRGLITYAQTVSLKIPSSTLSGWLSRHRLFVVHDGVFRVAGAPVTFEQRCLAATLAGGAGCFGSARAATHLWEMHVFDEPVVDVVVERSRLPRLDGVHVHRSRDLDRFSMTTRDGIPVTPPTLTLLDLAAVAPIDITREAMEQAFVLRLTTPKGLRTAYELVARPGRRGAGVIRGLLDDRSLGSKISDAKSEALFADLCRKVGLPKPVFHFKVYGADGRFIAEPDFAYPERRIAIEIDSVSIHGTPKALQHDLERQNELINAGWTVLRFSWHDVKFRPDYVTATIARCLGASAVR